MGGLILISLGIIFLLINFGFVQWSIFGFIWHFWPIILILLGLKLMAGGSRIGRTLISIFAALVVCYFLLYALYVTSPALQPALQPFAPYFPGQRFEIQDQNMTIGQPILTPQPTTLFQ